MSFQKNFPGGIPPDPYSGKGRPPLALNTQSGLWSGARRPGVGTQTLVPLNFSAAVAPLVLCQNLKEDVDVVSVARL